MKDEEFRGVMSTPNNYHVIKHGGIVKYVMFNADDLGGSEVKVNESITHILNDLRIKGIGIPRSVNIGDKFKVSHLNLNDYGKLIGVEDTDTYSNINLILDLYNNPAFIPHRYNRSDNTGIRIKSNGKVYTKLVESYNAYEVFNYKIGRLGNPNTMILVKCIS